MATDIYQPASFGHSDFVGLEFHELPHAVLSRCRAIIDRHCFKERPKTSKPLTLKKRAARRAHLRQAASSFRPSENHLVLLFPGASSDSETDLEIA
jgi:hypothetical protein